MFQHAPFGKLAFAGADRFGDANMLSMTNGITVSPTESGTFNEVRFKLANEGNYILLKDGSKHELKTPSQQQSGMKAKLRRGSVELEAGTEYQLYLRVDLEKQLNLNPQNHCILKPVWEAEID